MERFALSCWAALLPNSLQIFKLLFGIISVRLLGEVICFPWEMATQSSQALPESQPLANLNFPGSPSSQLLYLVLPASQAGPHLSLRHDFTFSDCVFKYFPLLPARAVKTLSTPDSVSWWINKQKTTQEVTERLKWTLLKMRQEETTWETKKENKYCHDLGLLVLSWFVHCFIYSCPLSDLLPRAAQSPCWTPEGRRWHTCHLCRKAIIREFPSPFIMSSSAILSWVFLPLKKCLQTSLLCVCSVPFNWSLCWFQLNYRH